MCAGSRVLQSNSKDLVLASNGLSGYYLTSFDPKARLRCIVLPRSTNGAWRWFLFDTMTNRSLKGIHYLYVLARRKQFLICFKGAIQKEREKRVIVICLLKYTPYHTYQRKHTPHSCGSALLIPRNNVSRWPGPVSFCCKPYQCDVTS